MAGSEHPFLTGFSFRSANNETWSTSGIVILPPAGCSALFPPCVILLSYYYWVTQQPAEHCTVWQPMPLIRTQGCCATEQPSIWCDSVWFFAMVNFWILLFFIFSSQTPVKTLLMTNFGQIQVCMVRPNISGDRRKTLFQAEGSLNIYI